MTKKNRIRREKEKGDFLKGGKERQTEKEHLFYIKKLR